MDSLNLPEGFTYLPISNQDGEHVFRIKEITDKSSVDEWVKLYSEQTKSVWRTATTFPKSGKINVYKVIFRCVHNTDRRATGARPSKHTGCQVKLTILVKRFIERPQVRTNDLLNKEYPTIVSLRGTHNHSCDTLRYRNLSSEVKLKFLNLFKQGHSPASALQRHKTDLLLEYGEQYHEVTTDGKYTPSYSVAHKLYVSEFKKGYRTFKGEINVFESLEESLSKYIESTGGVAEFRFSSDHEHHFIVLCSPMMLRTHEKLSQTSDLVMLDASRDVNKNGHHIYFFVTLSAAGAIPIGIIITDTENEDIFSEAVQCFKDCLPKTAFFSKQCPRIFIIDNDLTVFSGLKNVFPSSSVLLCHFHLLKTVWKWLCDSSHRIEPENRLELFFNFRELLYSEDDDAAKRNLNLLVEKAMKLKHTNFISYITKFLEHETMWINFYRENLPTRCNDANHYAELVFRLLKDCMLKKVKSFNIAQLVDYLISQYEMYCKRRFIDFCCGVYTDIVVRKILPHDIPENFVVHSKGFGIFSVTDENDQHFNVSLEQGMCSCSDNGEELCRHSSAVLLKLDSDIMTAYNIASTEDKETIFYIANGSSECQSDRDSPVPQSDRDSPVPSSPSLTSEQSIELLEPLENVSEIVANIENYVTSGNILLVAQNIEPLSSAEVAELDGVFSRIKEGLRSDPNNYVPAVRSFLQNVETLTDTGLLTGLYNFGR